MDLTLSASQMKKQGGLLGALAAGMLAPMIMPMVGKLFSGSGDQQGKGLVLPGTKGRGRKKKLQTANKSRNRKDDWSESVFKRHVAIKS